ncbi:unnamed protein product [Vicia faba]|uniref:Uncharacterized protein n=1 Tax=Vicia faba TaxID=3906 RepID=A0AAV1B2N9_VICFA|nr:unnamed protein product [Vicia faba]
MQWNCCQKQTTYERRHEQAFRTRLDFSRSAIRIKTAASKSKEGSASQTSIDTTEKANPPETTATAATTTTTITPTTSAPIPTTNKLPPTTPKKRKPSTTGEDPTAGGNSNTASKKKLKKATPKSTVPTSVSGLDSRDAAPLPKSKNPPSTSNPQLERIASNLSSEGPQNILNPTSTISTSPSKAAAPLNSSPQGDSSNLVQNKGSSNVAVLAGTSEQPDDQDSGTSAES